MSLQKLKAFYAERNAFFQERFNRTLPFGELVADRWEKAKMLGFGEGSSIYDSSVVMGRVKVGREVWIGPYTLLDGLRAELVIGDFCQLASGVHIYTHDSVARAITSGRAPLNCAPVHIGDCVYLGPYAIVTKGVTIGHHCIIGAQSFVNKDVMDYSVVMGQPGRVVGKVVLHDEGERYEIEYF